METCHLVLSTVPGSEQTHAACNGSIPHVGPGMHLTMPVPASLAPIQHTASPYQLVWDPHYSLLAWTDPRVGAMGTRSGIWGGGQGEGSPWTQSDPWKKWAWHPYLYTYQKTLWKLHEHLYIKATPTNVTKLSGATYSLGKGTHGSTCCVPGRMLYQKQGSKRYRWEGGKIMFWLTSTSTEETGMQGGSKVARLIKKR